MVAILNSIVLNGYYAMLRYQTHYVSPAKIKMAVVWKKRSILQ